MANIVKLDYTVDEINEKLGKIDDVVQTVGDSDNKVMSQKAVTGELVKFIEPSEVVEGQFVEASGRYCWYTQNGDWCTFKFPVVSGYKYTYFGLSNVGNAPKSAFLKSDGGFIHGISFKQEVGAGEIEIPSGGAFVVFSVNTVDIESFKFGEKKYAQTEQVANIEGQLKDKEMYENGIFTSILEEGTITSNGALENDSRRLRFTQTINKPFKVSVNNGYLIRFIVYYDKESGAFVRWVEANVTDFTANGENGIRLVFCKTDLEATIYLSEGASIFKDRLQNVTSSDLSRVAINALPPKDNLFAITKNPKPQLIWSDKYCWRNVADNNLTLGSTGYSTIKASDGAFVGGANTDVVRDWFSVTKILTALTTINVIEDLSQTVTVLECEYRPLETDTNLVQVGDVVTYNDLLNSLIIQSDNNAAHVLGYTVGYILNPDAPRQSVAVIAFVNRMREIMEQIGMSNSTVSDYATMSDLSGTPEDVCKLLKYVQDNSPVIRSIWGKLTHDMTVSGTNPRTWTITSTTTNTARELIPEFVGGKTGSSGTHGTYAWVWSDKDNGELYCSALCDFELSKQCRFTDARQIIDEVYSLKN